LCGEKSLYEASVDFKGFIGEGGIVNIGDHVEDEAVKIQGGRDVVGISGVIGGFDVVNVGHMGRLVFCGDVLSGCVGRHSGCVVIVWVVELIP
jgi:hypothetical protein